MSPVAAAIVALAFAIVAWLLLAPVLRARRQRRAASVPLTESRRLALEGGVPLRARLPAELRRRLDGLIAAFIAEKEFVGCNDLVVTDDMRVIIAAYGCVLILGRPHDLYRSLQSILVYPTPFWVDEEDQEESGLVTRRRHVLSGQAWESSRIILSWEDVVATTTTSPAVGNVVLHEFAHYLDAEGLGPAAPASGRRHGKEEWTRDLEQEFDDLVDALDHDEDTLLDSYAGEDEAEFFAVATEEFLERSAELRAARPRLYALLQEYYALDPAGWRNTG